jgi:hypothetical protein
MFSFEAEDPSVNAALKNSDIEINEQPDPPSTKPKIS